MEKWSASQPGCCIPRARFPVPMPLWH